MATYKSLISHISPVVYIRVAYMIISGKLKRYNLHT